MTSPAAEGHTPTVDLTTGAGQAIVALFRSIKDDIELGDDWPGADVVQVLTEWFTGLGIDPELPADDLPGANPNHCRSCDAHLAEPHSPGCPRDIEPTEAQHACAHVRVALAWTCPMAVVIDREDGVIADRRYIDEGKRQDDPTEAYCPDCHLALPAEDPAVVQAQQIQDQAVEWPAGGFGP
jgi:hypothetical protein